MQSQFISEPITPVSETIDTTAMAIGEPGLPMRFLWRKQEYTIAEVLEKWKETGPCMTHGGTDRYVRKHWYRLRTTDGIEMKIYFERKPHSYRKKYQRWWLFSLESNGQTGDV